MNDIDKYLDKVLQNNVEDDAEHTIYEISKEKECSPLFPITKVIKDSFSSIKDRYFSREMITGIPTGFKKFDELTSGLQKSNLIILASHPWMGKTAFALNVALNVALTQTPVAIFSLDKFKEEIGLRLLSSEARIDLESLQKGSLGEKDWTKLTTAAERFAGAPLFIDDTPDISVSTIATKVRRLKADAGLGLIIVDYIQLIRDGNNKPKILEICRSLKELAIELKIPIIAISQTTSTPRDRFPDRRPKIEDLRENNVYAQVADLITFIYRDEVYNTSDDNPDKGMAEIIVARHRNGPVGSVRLAFTKEYSRYENLKPSDGITVGAKGSCH